MIKKFNINKCFEFIKKKKKIIIISLLILIVFYSLFIIFRDVYYSNFSDDSGKIMYEYSKLNNKKEDNRKYPQVNLTSDNLFVYKDIDYVLDIFDNKDDAVVFFAYSDCVYCRSAIQVLHDTAKDTDLDEIIYIDAEEKNGQYAQLKDKIGDEFFDDNGDIYIPLVLFIVDGKIVSNHIGTLFSHVDPFDDLTEDQIEGITYIYKYGIRDVVLGKKSDYLH